MKTKTKLRPFQFLQRLFPVWALKQQSRIMSRTYETSLKHAKTSAERQELEFEQYIDLSEYEEAIQTIHSRHLMAKARELFIFIPDLKWKEGQFGGRFLEEESLSRLHHAVKAQADTIRDYRLRLATAATGIIGALIGLLAVWKK